MPNGLPSLNGLRAFEASARLQSFKRASEELFVTPSAISQQIKGLEDYLGIPLFRRLPQGVELTAEGRRLLPALERAFADMAQAVRQLKSDSRNVLRISAPPAFSSLWLVPRLREFSSLHPDIEANLHSSLDLVNFESDEFDCAIRSFLGPRPQTDSGPQALSRQHLFDMELFCVANPERLKNKSGRIGLPRAPHDLNQFTLLHFGNYTSWAMWSRFYGTNTLDTNAGIVCNEVDQLIRNAAVGQGVALVDERALAESPYRNHLEPLFPDQVRYCISFYFVAPTNRWQQKDVQSFYSWLRQQVDEMHGYYGFDQSRVLSTAVKV